MGLCSCVGEMLCSSRSSLLACGARNSQQPKVERRKFDFTEILRLQINISATRQTCRAEQICLA